MKNVYLKAEDGTDVWHHEQECNTKELVFY